MNFKLTEAVIRRCSIEKVFLKYCNITGKPLQMGLFFNKVAGWSPAAFFKKEALAQIYSCEFCENFRNTYFVEHLKIAAFKLSFKYWILKLTIVEAVFLHNRAVYRTIKGTHEIVFFVYFFLMSFKKTYTYWYGALFGF